MSQSQETREAMLNMWADGKSFHDIGVAFHVSRNTVCGYVKRAREKGDVRAAYRKSPPKLIAPVIKKPVIRPRTEALRALNVHRFEVGEELLPPKLEYKPRFKTPKPKPEVKPMPPADPSWATSSMREGGGIGLLDLPFTGACKWPLGDPREPSFLYCGASTDEKHVYCVCHRAIAYGRGTPSEQKAVRVALRFA